MIGTSTSNTLRKLNPYNWFMTSQTSNVSLREAFNYQQTSSQFNTAFYPFTEIHPYESLLHRARISLFGESLLERVERLRLRDGIWDSLMPVSLNDHRSGSLTSVSGFASPSVSNLGLGTRYTSNSGLLDHIEAGTSYSNTAFKINSLPSTPKALPLNNLADNQSVWSDEGSIGLIDLFN